MCSCWWISVQRFAMLLSLFLVTDIYQKCHQKPWALLVYRYVCVLVHVGLAVLNLGGGFLTQLVC